MNRPGGGGSNNIENFTSLTHECLSGIQGCSNLNVFPLQRKVSFLSSRNVETLDLPEHKQKTLAEKVACRPGTVPAPVL